MAGGKASKAKLLRGLGEHSPAQGAFLLPISFYGHNANMCNAAKIVALGSSLRASSACERAWQLKPDKLQRKLLLNLFSIKDILNRLRDKLSAGLPRSFAGELARKNIALNNLHLAILQPSSAV